MRYAYLNVRQLGPRNEVHSISVSFGMVVLALYRILPVNYLGEIIIVLFISGLVYAWLNTWHQTEKLVTKTVSSKKSEATQQPEKPVSTEKEELITASSH